MHSTETGTTRAVVTSHDGRVLLVPAGAAGLALPAGPPPGTTTHESTGTRPASRWATPGELQVLADRTAWYAHGRMPAAEFADDPGLAPWSAITLNELGVLSVHQDDLPAIAHLAATGTPRVPAPREAPAAAGHQTGGQ
jgi:hypothetical protein